MSHELVGCDAAGNQYVRQMMRNESGDERERRWVEFPSEKGAHYYDASSMPPEWHQWLNHGRSQAPTEQHIMEAEAAREAIRQKAAIIDDAAFGQRLRAQAYSVNQSTANSPEDAARPQLTHSATEDLAPPTVSSEESSPQEQRDTRPSASQMSEDVSSWVPPQR